MSDFTANPLYGTANSAEALCLYTAGIPLHPDQQCENLYTPAWLAENGFASVTDATTGKNPKRGLCSWFFVASERQQNLSAEFMRHSAALKLAGNTKPTADLPKLRDADFAAMCAYLQSNRKFIENLWKGVPPKKATPDGRGGWNFIGANASEADKRRLGV